MLTPFTKVFKMQNLGTTLIKNPLVQTVLALGLLATGVATFIALYDRKRNIELLKLNIDIRKLELERLKKELNK